MIPTVPQEPSYAPILEIGGKSHPELLKYIANELRQGNYRHQSVWDCVIAWHKASQWSLPESEAVQAVIKETINLCSEILSHDANAMTLLAHMCCQGQAKMDDMGSEIFWKFHSRHGISNLPILYDAVLRDFDKLRGAQHIAHILKCYKDAADKKEERSLDFIETNSLNDEESIYAQVTRQYKQHVAPDLDEVDAFTELCVHFVKVLGKQQDYVQAIQPYVVWLQFYDLCLVPVKKGLLYLQDAIELYQNAIKQQHAMAMVKLAILYTQGFGLQADRDIAKDLYEAAIELQEPDALYHLACLYLSLGGEQNDTQALTLFKKAAEKDHTDAMFRLGRFYQEGLIVTKDIAKASEFYIRAAALGHVGAMRPLADIYFANGNKTGLSNVLVFFEQAAALGHPNAMYFLAAVYQIGRICPKDEIKAARLCRYSAMLQHDEAAALLEKVKSPLFQYHYNMEQLYLDKAVELMIQHAEVQTEFLEFEMMRWGINPQAHAELVDNVLTALKEKNAEDILIQILFTLDKEEKKREIFSKHVSDLKIQLIDLIKLSGVDRKDVTGMLSILIDLWYNNGGQLQSLESTRAIADSLSALLTSKLSGCDLHAMSELPQNYVQYKNSYIVIKKNATRKLYYIESDEGYKKVKIIDCDVFKKEIKAIIKNKGETTIHLSEKQIREIVTLNGGHTRLNYIPDHLLKNCSVIFCHAMAGEEYTLSFPAAADSLIPLVVKLIELYNKENPCLIAELLAEFASNEDKERPIDPQLTISTSGWLFFHKSKKYSHDNLHVPTPLSKDSKRSLDEAQRNQGLFYL